VEVKKLLLILLLPSSVYLLIIVGRTPLMLAVINSQPEAISLLLGLGASPHLRDLDGRTAYELACRKKGTPMTACFEDQYDATVCLFACLFVCMYVWMDGWMGVFFCCVSVSLFTYFFSFFVRKLHDSSR
jgi:hypothetical protein